MAVTQADTIYNNVTFQANVNFNGTMSLAADSVKDTDVKADADIGFAKVQHVHHVVLRQAVGTAATDESRIVFVARAPCTVLAVDYSISAAAVGAADADIDVQKSTAGGAFATILTGVATIDNTDVARVVANASLSGTPTMIANDMLLISIDETTGGGTQPQGIVVDVTIAEEGQ